MENKKKYKILMLGKPGGTLSRTYDWHIEALNSDTRKRFDVDHIDDVLSQGMLDLNPYDIVWFYAKAFHPNIFMQIKNASKNKKIICGPNILLDKPDIGISDKWDEWYVNQCRPDIHLDQVKFYSEHVKKFLSTEMKDKAMCLDKCINLDDTLYKPDTEKEYDCLVYSKKRRYDIKFEEFRDGLISLLESNNISFCEVRAGKFGKYEREDYFNLLNKSKIMVNLSLDECPGILNYESMFFNVPVVGSRKNVPINHSDLCYVEDVDVMTPQYLVRTESSELKYIEKIKQVLENYDNIVNEESPRDFITKHTSYENYCDNVAKIIEELYSE